MKLVNTLGELYMQVTKNTETKCCCFGG